MQMFQYTLTASIVLYKSDKEIIKKAIDSFLQITLPKKLFLIDNSPGDDLKFLAQGDDIEYIKNETNIGFGKAHNIALRKAITLSKYHLILNPDIYFESSVIEVLSGFMDNNSDIGLIIPKVLDFESNVQNVCKRLPSPIDLIIRRLKLNFVSKLFNERVRLYELSDRNFDQPFVAPSLSGCFMFLRVGILQEVGLFDERYFMYMEDVDLSRRIRKHFKTYYYPYVKIYHGHARESYKLNKLFFIHIYSAIKYFSKWGWFIDREREKFNKL